MNAYHKDNEIYRIEKDGEVIFANEGANNQSTSIPNVKSDLIIASENYDRVLDEQRAIHLLGEAIEESELSVRMELIEEAATLYFGDNYEIDFLTEKEIDELKNEFDLLVDDSNESSNDADDTRLFEIMMILTYNGITY